MFAPRSIRWSVFLVHTILLLGFSVAVAQSDASTPTAASPPPPGQVWRNVTVTDIHGWDYRGVTIRWIDDGRTLEVRRPDGASREFRPDDVARIRDDRGRDITTRVALGRDGSVAPPADGGAGHTADPESMSEITGDPEVGAVAGSPAGETLADLVAPPLFAVAWDVALGYATNTGSWFTGLDDGVNYQAGLRAMVSPRTWLRFVFRRQDLGTVRIGYDYDLDVPVEAEFKLNEFMLMVGRHARLVETPSVRSVGYAEFGFSVMDHRVGLVDYGGGSANETKMGLGLNGGLLIFLAEEVAADLSATATWKPGLSETERGGLLLGARAGLAVMF